MLRDKEFLIEPFGQSSSGNEAPGSASKVPFGARIPLGNQSRNCLGGRRGGGRARAPGLAQGGTDYAPSRFEPSQKIRVRAALAVVGLARWPAEQRGQEAQVEIQAE